jgi:hypothetical protein
MKKKSVKRTITELINKRLELEYNIQLMKDFIAHCPSSYLGPLGAKAEIRKCNKEIALIDEELQKKNYKD